MAQAPVIVAFVSQKGGTGKSTLARALAAVVAHAGLKVAIADLDPHQQTVTEWERLRDHHGNEPPISVAAFDSAAEAIASAEDEALLIIDAPAHANRGTLDIGRAATLVVQPTGASLDDLRPAVLLFHELVKAGVAKDRLVAALCRTLTATEEDMARHYLAAAGYDVLPGSIPERSAYREAHNRGQAVTEAGRKALDAKVHALMDGLYARINARLKARTRPVTAGTKRKQVS